MSNYSDINGDVRANLSQEGFRHYNGTSTAAGAADGTTIIDTALPGIDDSWNNAQCLILSGDFSEMTPKEVEGFTESSGTLTFTNNPVSRTNSRKALITSFTMAVHGVPLRSESS